MGQLTNPTQSNTLSVNHFSQNVHKTELMPLHTVQDN